MHLITKAMKKGLHPIVGWWWSVLFGCDATFSDICMIHSSKDIVNPALVEMLGICMIYTLSRFIEAVGNI